MRKKNMNSTIRAEFSATLSRSRPSAFFGNTELYSLNESFATDGSTWKFTIAPTAGSLRVRGFIDKVNAMQSIPLTRAEAEIAVRGIFLAVADVDVNPQIMSPISFCTHRAGQHCFELLALIGSPQLLKQSYSPAGLDSSPNWTNLKGLHSGRGFVGNKQFFTCGTCGYFSLCGTFFKYLK